MHDPSLISRAAIGHNKITEALNVLRTFLITGDKTEYQVSLEDIALELEGAAILTALENPRLDIADRYISNAMERMDKMRAESSKLIKVWMPLREAHSFIKTNYGLLAPIISLEERAKASQYFSDS